MRPPHRPPSRLGSAPFTTRAVRGLITKEQLLASGAYQRLCRGAYVPASATVGYAQRVAGFTLVLPEQTVLVGATAAWALGAWEPMADDDVEVNLAPSGAIRSRPGLRVSAMAIPEDDVVTTRAGRATSALRTAVDVACREPTEVAVPLLDALLRRHELTPWDVVAAMQASGRRRGTRRACATLALVDPRSESPQESRLRLVVIEAGLPAPKVQWTEPVGPGWTVRLDLAWPDLKVAVEYDGWPHHGAARRSADLARHNALRALGWTVIQVDARALARPGAFLAQLHTVLARANS